MENAVFWIIAGGLAAAVAGLLALALWRGRAQSIPAQAFDVQLYRDQLSEVDRDLARGTVTETEADRLRTEISRRLLEADRQASAATAMATPRAARVTALALTLAVTAGALALYARLGVPGYPDLGLAARIAAAEETRLTRPRQAEAEASLPPFSAPADTDPRYLEMMEKLREAAPQRPGDPQGWRLLARNEAALGNFAAAHVALARLLALNGDDAEAGDWAFLAELMVRAAGGYVSPEAEAVVTEALARDPRNGPARYFLGLMYLQTGRPDLTFRLWRGLLAESVPEAPWVPPIEAQIADVAQAAGVRYTPPARPASPGAAGPSAADVAAAAEMTPQERTQMIRTMVDGLGERLAAEGGPAEDWAQLIRALGVLGETDRAAATWAQAQEIFAARPEALAVVRAAASEAGVVQ